ncbi:MAG: pseudouridine synthase [Rhodocyclaceae bacterium]|jgi:tRNA pseudouridine32 synthase/23S rRNA pseudouridine746 synthase|nr:pseudouridine synthase [Rhodocyclaceae bacterium]
MPHDALVIAYQDEDLLALVKPSGLLSVPGRGPENQDSSTSRVQSQFPAALPVHRLDMDTSGLLLFALSKAVHRQLSIQFQERGVFKRYIALVAGCPAAASGVIELPLICDWPNRPRQKVDFLMGKPSLTHYRVLAIEPGKNASRLALEPLTGRSHQLRVHLMALGHPILGDPLYAPEGSRQGALRLMLHAEALALPHPVTGAPLEILAPSPF